MSKYSEKLRDPKWQKMRLKIMERDNFKCKLCGREDKTLNVHHLYYAKNGIPWDVGESDLITICELCHWKTHTEEINKNPIIRFLYLSKNIMKGDVNYSLITNEDYNQYLNILTDYIASNFTMILDEKANPKLDYLKIIQRSFIAGLSPENLINYISYCEIVNKLLTVKELKETIEAEKENLT